MASDKIPVIPAELIEYLARMFPNTLPSQFRGEFDMGKRFGAASVVSHLVDLRNQQNEDLLSNQLRG